MDASVSEIHAYPARPGGFVEPLFPTPASRREIAEHLLEAPWLARASGLAGRPGQEGGPARTSGEPVRVEKTRDGRTTVVRSRERRAGGRADRCSRGRPEGRPKGRPRGRSWRRRRVVEVLDRWREVRGWWEDGGGVDRVVFRVLLSGGPIVDLALERSGGWFLTGVVD